MLVVVDTGCETYLYNLQSVIITILAVVAVIILCVGKHVSLLCIAVMWSETLVLLQDRS